MSELDIESLGLGRRAAPDSRDENYPIRELFRPENIERRYRSWPAHVSALYQASFPHCVAFSWLHFIVDSPMTHKVVDMEPGSATVAIRGTNKLLSTSELYYLCQKIDEWPGEDYNGTSVRAGAKVLKGLELISEYRWAFNVDDMVNCLLTQGPVIVGTNWYRGMSIPSSDHFISPSGPMDGGHAYKVDGVNVPSERFRIKNSWSTSWGRRGFAFITFDDMAKLLHEDGEACIALEA